MSAVRWRRVSAVRRAVSECGEVEASECSEEGGA